MTYDFDVALSFAGEDRDYVERVAEILVRRQVSVFYDRYVRAELWGKDLYEHLDDVYCNRARFCILFASRHYADKLWTNHERKSAQARALEEHGEYVLPVRFDDTPIPGVRSTVGFIDLRQTSATDLADLIVEKLSRSTMKSPSSTVPPRPDGSEPPQTLDAGSAPTGSRAALTPRSGVGQPRDGEGSAGTWVAGNQNVQIQDVTGSTIQITYVGQRHRVPLEPAVIAVGKNVRSPARLVRARSGVVPYSARAGLLAELQAWLGGGDGFAVSLVGGRGGSGKTRLGVELCEQARGAGWLSGLLTASVDEAALEALADAPTARLVVVDYAETRGEQLEVMLPLLASAGTADHPVRVVLLVRSAPRDASDWTAVLRNRSDALDTVLDDTRQWILNELPLDVAEREALFDAAATALAARADPPLAPPDAPDSLSELVFASPLMVVIGAYLVVHGATQLPTSKAELLDELLHHEQRYWKQSAHAHGIDDDPVLAQRVVALATLAGAGNEAEAVGLLDLVPDLEDASAKERGRLARWVHELYPTGPAWWNPLEPDLVGEHLVATTYTDAPAVLTGVLTRDSPHAVARPLGVYARAAADHPALADALSPILTGRLQRLCELAVDQVAAETDLELLLGETTIAAVLNRVVSAITIDPGALHATLDLLPRRPDLVLGPLALTIQSQLAAHHRRRLAATDPATEGDLVAGLHDLSVRLGEAGRHEEGLAAIEEAIGRFRRVSLGSAADQRVIAAFLNKRSVFLGEVGRREEGLAAIEDAVRVWRRLVALDPATHEPELAGALINLSADLAKAERHEEALAAIEEAVGLWRRLVAIDPAAHEPDLAMSLNTLSNRLEELGRYKESLLASEEAVRVRRRQAAKNPTAYEPNLASALNNLANRFVWLGRHEEALATIQEAVDVCRRAAAANPTAHDPLLALSLTNLSVSLADLGRGKEALAAVEEAVRIRQRLTTANPARHQRDLQNSLALRLSLLRDPDGGVPRHPDEASPQHAARETPVRDAPLPKVGRNDLCPCGSGKKYKRCHGG